MGALWGIIPAAGCGTRIQPLAFSKELLPVGSSGKGDGERPRAISEYLIERMILAGVEKINIVVSPGKWDIIRYFGNGIGDVHFCYSVQQQASGLCDAIFCAIPLINNEDRVIVGLPDTVWFPVNGLCDLPSEVLSFLLFPVDHPEFYDAVEVDVEGRVKKIHVKQIGISQRWIWGAFSMPGHVFHELHRLWQSRQPPDEYFGTLVNDYVNRGGLALGVKSGMSYVDVGTLNGYREAMGLLSGQGTSGPLRRAEA